MNPVIAAILIPSMLLCQLFGTITHRHGLGKNASEGVHFHFPTDFAIEHSEQKRCDSENNDRQPQESISSHGHQHPHTHNHSDHHSHHRLNTSCIDLAASGNDNEDCQRRSDVDKAFPDQSDHDNNAIYLNFDEIVWNLTSVFRFQFPDLVLFFVSPSESHCCQANDVSGNSGVLNTFYSGRELLRHHCALLL